MRITILSKKYLYQYIATIAGSMAVLTSGINLGWTSPYLPKLLNSTYSDITMTSNEAMWCAIMPLIGAIPGALATMLIVDRIGRRNSVLIMAPITLAAFVLLAFSNHTSVILFVRFVIGSVEGGLYTALPIYFGEISNPEIRGILTATMGLCSIIGTLLINVVGFYFSIFTSSLVCGLIPVLHFITFMWLPESPYFFIKKGNKNAAEKSLKCFRNSDDVSEELDEMIKAVARQESNKKAKITDLFTIESNRRAVWIHVILNFTRKFTAKNPLLFYTLEIFQLADGALSSFASVIIFICVEAVAALSGVLIIDKVGRRPLVIASSLVCAITLSLTGTYFLLKTLDDSYISYIGWLPLTSLILYNIFYTMGLELAHVTYLGELFPTNVKAAALGMADVLSVINGAITSVVFQILTDNFGMFSSFYSFSAACIFGLVLIIIYVPETKNKTLEEIQLSLMKYNSNKKQNR